MWLDLVGLAILAVFMVMGLLRGTLASLLRIVSLVIAYGAAIWAAPALGPAAAERMSLPSFLGVPIAGSLAFLATYTVLGIGSKLLQSWERRRREGEERSIADRVGGSLLGAVQGAFIMLLIGWLGLWIDAGQASGSLQFVPDTSGSALARVSQVVVETGAAVMIGDDEPSARLAVNMAARPKETMAGMQRVFSNPRIQGLQNDRLFWSYVESGALDAALNQGSFLGIAHDETLRHELADLGLIQQTAASNPFQFRQEIRGILALVGPRMQELAEDPELQDLAQDPRVREALEQGDTLTLLRDPKVQRAVSDLLAP